MEGTWVVEGTAQRLVSPGTWWILPLCNQLGFLLAVAEIIVTAALSGKAGWLAAWPCFWLYTLSFLKSSLPPVNSQTLEYNVHVQDTLLWIQVLLWVPMAFKVRSKRLHMTNAYVFTFASAAGISSICLFPRTLLFKYTELEFSESSDFLPTFSSWWHFQQPLTLSP